MFAVRSPLLVAGRTVFESYFRSNRTHVRLTAGEWRWRLRAYVAVVVVAVERAAAATENVLNVYVNMLPVHRDRNGMHFTFTEH